jgi:hypothetical protein
MIKSAITRIVNKLMPKKISGMKTVNISTKDTYHTQINNKKVPLTSCFATSVIMKLSIQKIKIYDVCNYKHDVNYFENVTGWQPEDYLTSILCTDEAKDYFEKIAGRRPKNNEQRFYYTVVEWAVNKILCRKEVVKYKKISIQEIMKNIDRKIPVVCGGKFTSSGHMVCVVGYTKDSIIIDDPYGNYHTDYRDSKGNNIEISLDLFNQLTDKYNNENEKRAIV